MIGQYTLADLTYIENLTFSDRSPGSSRANATESVLRLDANDTSFAAAAGWGGSNSSWQQQFDHTKQLVAANQDAGLVFIGDSLAQNWGNVDGRLVNGSGAGTWNSSRFNFDQYGALNLGIAGDQTQNVIYRINNGQLNGITPGLVVLMVGTNNLYVPTGNPGFPVADYVGPVHTAEEIADGVLATVQALHAKLPNAHILALSVLRGLNNSDPDRIAANTANGLLADAFNTDTNPLLLFLDISHRFRNPDGSINNRIGSDGMHLTAAGYEAWADAISPYVNKFAND